jgi:3-oxoacyl-[acyl-carrier protein] reductase
MCSSYVISFNTTSRNLCVLANLQNYKSPSSAPKVEAIVKEIRRINPSVRVGIIHADVLSTYWLARHYRLFIYVYRGDVDIGQKFLKASADVFTDGDISQLKIHILVHNAADARFLSLEEETWESINDQLQANSSFCLTAS